MQFNVAHGLAALVEGPLVDAVAGLVVDSALQPTRNALGVLVAQRVVDHGGGDVEEALQLGRGGDLSARSCIEHCFVQNAGKQSRNSQTLTNANAKRPTLNPAV